MKTTSSATSRAVDPTGNTPQLNIGTLEANDGSNALDRAGETLRSLVDLTHKLDFGLIPRRSNPIPADSQNITLNLKKRDLVEWKRIAKETRKPLSTLLKTVLSTELEKRLATRSTSLTFSPSELACLMDLATGLCAVLDRRSQPPPPPADIPVDPTKHSETTQ